MADEYVVRMHEQDNLVKIWSTMNQKGSFTGDSAFSAHLILRDRLETSDETVALDETFFEWFGIATNNCYLKESELPDGVCFVGNVTDIDGT